MFKKKIVSLFLAASLVLCPAIQSTASVVSGGDGTQPVVTTSEPDESEPGDNEMAPLGETAEGNKITQDFENVGSDWWGMTGALVSDGKLSLADGDNGKYLAVSGEKCSTRTASKVFEDLPDMLTAQVDFTWYTKDLTSDNRNGRPGVRIKDGDIDLVSVYMGEIRGKETTPVYYSTQGTEITQISGKTLSTSEAHAVSVSIDFTALKATVTIDGEEYVSVDISSAATQVDTLELAMAGSVSSGKTFVVNMGIDDFSLAYTKPENGTITQDFENADSDWWGMSGSLVDQGMLSLADGDNGKYLAVNGSGYSTRTASKVFEDLPDMATAQVDFTWYTKDLTSDSRNGRPGVRIKDGDIDLVSVYMGDARGSGSAPVYYSTQGTGITQISGKTLSTSKAHAVSISIDFAALKATVKIDGEEYVSVDISAAAAKVDTLELAMAGSVGSGKTFVVNMGIDDFSLEYTGASGIVRAPYVKEVSALENVTATKEDYEKGFAHYDSVEVVLSNGTNATVGLESWTSDRAVNPDDWGTYVWTAQLVMPDDGSITNPLELTASYTMDYKSDFLETDINSLKMPETVNVKKDQWVSGAYSHPTSVAATLVNTRVISVPIDSESWTCEPAFDVDTKGTYVWTADIIAPEGNRNHRDLKVSYTMNYYGSYVSSHDYENDFVFGIIDWNVWGKDVDSTSGTGGYGFQIKQDGDNAYLYGEVERSGSGRGSRLDLTGSVIKGASLEFDWMPVIVSSGHADLLFMSPAAKQNYFTLTVGTDGVVSYYTTPDSNNTSSIKSDFEGVISEANRVSTGVGEIGKWMHVKLDFDYINHTADLAVTSLEDPDKTAVKEDIPISPDANGLSLIVMRKPGACGKSGNALDNIFADYDNFGPNDIVSVTNPSNINITKASYPDYQFPEEVTAKLGSGASITVKVGKWTAVPEFNPETEGVYEWSAPLTVPEGYTNYFDLKAVFTMNYLDKNYVSSVNNPSTLELEFGAEWNEEQMGKVATVILSDGSILTDAPVGEWTAIRAFQPDEEGIYIYGAKLADDDRYVIDRTKLTPNEQHTRDDLKDSFTYDVYYRISYYKSNNNYNGYTRSMEYLDRGVTAVPSGNGILVSWRLLVDEYGSGIQFNVLRNGKVINASPVSTKTNYLDADGKPGDKYAVQVIKDGKKSTTESVTALDQNYLSIKLQKPEPQLDKDGNYLTYSINDAGVADVDGDGEYEIVVKWYPSDAFDSGSQPGPSAPTIFDFYKMDGTALWRLNMGLELSSGAHWNQFMFYDLDEDGSAEFFIKTSDGTASYKPNAQGKFDMADESTLVSYIGDKSVIPGVHVNGSGHVNPDSNEYVSVFDGLTGKEIDTIDYINELKNFDDYGDNYGNRAGRFNIALAYLPADKNDPNCTSTIPAVLLNRGYYAKTTVAAYTLRNGKLQLEWNFDTAEAGSQYTSKGNHNIATGDVDSDGFDELVIGALALDHDGTVLWAKDGKDGQDYQGHADAIHLTAMNPDKPTQLYVFTPAEDSGATLNGTLSNAANGSRINGLWSAPADIGRGVAANITPNPGFEYWANRPNSEENPTGAIFNFFGGVIASTPPSTFTTNWTSYWDGDLLSELPDGRNAGGSGTDQAIYKYNWETNSMDTIAVFEGTHTNNSTKNNPSLTADLFGDWREEIMVPVNGDEEIRIYMTDYTTEYMIYSLMQDPVYRNAVANQNTAYNQPPHLGFYLGEDNADDVLAMNLPTPKIAYTTYHAPTEDPEVNKEELKEKIDEVVSGKVASDAYTAESYRAYSAALAKAQSILMDPNATQDEVDEALAALAAAYEALVPVSSEPVPGGSEEPSKPAEADKKSLQAEVDKHAGEKLDAGQYTAESYNAYTSALEKAQSVLADPEATQEEVDAALKALAEAYGNLKAVSQPSESEESSQPDDSGEASQPGEDTTVSPKTADGNPDLGLLMLTLCLALLTAVSGTAVLYRRRSGRN